MFKPEQSYTLEEYRKLVELDPHHKYEYVHGHVRMMAGGTPWHGQLGGRLFSLLDIALRNSECNVYSSDVAIILSEQCTYYPDASVSCDPHDWTRKKGIEAPTVIIEVHSPTTRHIDQREKLSTYRNYPTIQDILYVESQRKSVTHHYRRFPSPKWETNHFTHDDDIIELAGIEVSLTVRDIYYKVYLELEE